MAMRASRFRSGARAQRGAAVLLALFVVTLATVIVTGLFWRQFVVFRTVQNEQAGAQSRLLLHGAQDWARSILQDQTHPSYDTLSDSWAQPLAQTRLDQLGETAPLAMRATIEGGIEDAQGRFNLRNLVDGAGNINPGQLAVLEKLCGLLSAPAGTARLIAGDLALAYAGSAPAPVIVAGAAPAAPSTAVSPGATRLLPPVFPEDLAGIPGIDPSAALVLAPFVIVLDQAGTQVNFNTARPELMAATIPELSMSDANTLAAERDRAYFVGVSDIQNRLHGRGGILSPAGISTNSQYFLIDGIVRLDQGSMRLRSLVRRLSAGPQGSVQVLWERDQ